MICNSSSLQSHGWKKHFLDMIRHCLPQPLSDDFPILLDRGSRYFKFENTWLKVEGFVDLVKQSWNSYQCLDNPSFVFAYKLK
jgi:hypothetical protein